MKLSTSIRLTFVLFISFACSSFAQDSFNLSPSGNQFAVDLYAHLAASRGNIFFSPFSLSSALEMAYEGARGPTAQDMRTVLHLSTDDQERRAERVNFIQDINRVDNTYEFLVANAFWASKSTPFKFDYLDLVKNTYFSEAHNLNFAEDPQASRLIINKWISHKTNDRIQDLLPEDSVTADVRLILTNAVYFKAKWEIPFDQQLTRLEPFWLDYRRSVQLSLMSIQGASFYYAENNQVKILQIPYQARRLSMIIILPRSKNIRVLERALSLDQLKKWEERLVFQKVNVYLPKFKFDSSYQLKGVLSDMGMNLAFDEQNANFSGMVNKRPDDNFYIGAVFHKAWIETDEQGTVAASATDVTMDSLSDFSEGLHKEFRADHPFIFLIQDNKTGRFLFMGRVSDPRES